MKQCKIYTKTGDDGTTGLGNGLRVNKHHIRVAVCGTVDELNSMLGLIRTYTIPIIIDECLAKIQHQLFELNSEVSLSISQTITKEHIQWLEQQIDQFDQQLPPLTNFILPGGTREAALCHLARTICRRAERDIVALHHQEVINPLILSYLNRLSDLLFVVARFLVISKGKNEVLWN